mgnify:CR=1 FL=1
MSAQYNLPVALDESASGVNTLMELHAKGWRGPMTVKPSLLGALDLFIAWRDKYLPNLIYSSAFETAIGFHSFLRTALSDPRKEIPALGAGKLSFFPDDGLQLYDSSSRLNLWQFTSDDFTNIWDRLPN